MIFQNSFKLLVNFSKNLPDALSSEAFEEQVDFLSSSQNTEALIIHLKNALDTENAANVLIQFWGLECITQIIEEGYNFYISPDFEKQMYQRDKKELIQEALDTANIKYENINYDRLIKLIDDFVLIRIFKVHLNRKTDADETEIREPYLTLNRLITLYEYGNLNLYQELLKLEEMPYSFSSLIGYDGKHKLNLKSKNGLIFNPLFSLYIKIQKFIDMPHMAGLGYDRPDIIKFWIKFIDAFDKDLKEMVNYEQIKLQELYLAFPEEATKARFNRLMFTLFRNFYPDKLLSEKQWMNIKEHAAFDKTSYSDYQRKTVLGLMGLRNTYPHKTG